MRIQIPDLSVVVLIGTSGAGKSTFCKKHFLPTEVVSSDYCRGMVSNDENSLEATNLAFQLVHFIARKRLEFGNLVVIDATNVQQEARRPLLKIAEEYHALKVAIVLDVPPDTCHERNKGRADRQFGEHVIKHQHRDLVRSIRGQLRAERYHKLFILKPEDIENIEIVREPLLNQKLEETGPFDIIGDIHGCISELRTLLEDLGWTIDPEMSHPDGRKLIFLGDLVDRGPDSVAVLKLVMKAVESGVAFCVPGNHDTKLAKALAGKDVSKGHGLTETLAQLELETPEFRQQVRDFIDSRVSHLVLDGGSLCVAHAGMREDMMGRGSRSVREFALYGETTGEIDEFGLPVRYKWAADYQGKATVVYGHTPVPEPEWLNRTINIDTGCCFGGRLTALRYPEKTTFSVQSLETYAEPARPIASAPELSAQHEVDSLLSIDDVLGRRRILTRLAGTVSINEENAIAALEIMSRFAADPKWLIYLPPTMSPSATSDRDGYLEYPTEALQAFRKMNVEKVICQEKHMGSRAVIVLCRNAEAAVKRFGITTGESGIILSRTGRRFFEDIKLEQTIVGRITAAAEAAGIFEELQSEWLLLDTELMPWSAKAQGLLTQQYAPVGAAARAAGSFVESVASQVKARGLEFETPNISESGRLFTEAYRRYCWKVSSIDDYRIAPFHLLASEGAVHIDKDHLWHLGKLAAICEHESKLLQKTNYKIADLSSEEECQAICDWWETMTGKGGEGMVVKPLEFFRAGSDMQPAVKCRGPEYLRIIYGPDYLEAENLVRLRRRGLGRKQSLARREFALGVEAMERFVAKEPLRKVHECAFGILALESEPVDPRL